MNQQQQQVRRNMVQFRLSDQEAQLLKAMMMETRLSHEEIMLAAFTRLAQVRQMQQEGYRAAFLDEDGNEYQKQRIIVPGE
jgi:hypothetical protein